MEIKDFIKEGSDLPDYIFKNRYDKFHFFYDHILTNKKNSELFFNFFKGFLEKNGENFFYVSDYVKGVEKKVKIDLCESNAENWNLAKGKNKNSLISNSETEFLNEDEELKHLILRILPEIYFYSQTANWCIYCNKSIDLVIIALKECLNDSFVTEYKKNENENFRSITLPAYTKWHSEVFEADKTFYS
jgi:hypothetical protein